MSSNSIDPNLEIGASIQIFASAALLARKSDLKPAKDDPKAPFLQSGPISAMTVGLILGIFALLILIYIGYQKWEDRRNRNREAAAETESYSRMENGAIGGEHADEEVGAEMAPLAAPVVNDGALNKWVDENFGRAEYMNPGPSSSEANMAEGNAPEPTQSPKTNLPSISRPPVPQPANEHSDITKPGISALPSMQPSVSNEFVRSSQERRRLNLPPGEGIGITRGRPTFKG